jgi:hypothetical protein
MVPAVVKQKRSRPAARWSLAAALITLLPRAAAAHPEVSPQLVNRYLSLIAVGDRLEFFVTFLYGALPGAEARKRLDGDGDGKISEAERQAGQAEWQRRAPALATLTVDGLPVPLDGATADLQLGPDTGVGPAPLVVEVYGSRPLADGERRLGLAAGWDPPRLGETELALDLSAGWDLVASRQGSGAEEHLTRYKLDPAAKDRSVTFVIRPQGAPPHRRPLGPVAALVAVLAAVGLAAELARRRRPSPPG